MKTNNDRLAEYVREKYPEMERSMDYIFYKAAAGIRDAVKCLSLTPDIRKEIDKMEELELEELELEELEMEEEDEQ